MQMWIRSQLVAIREAILGAVSAAVDTLKTYVGGKVDALDEKVTPYLYEPCTDKDIDQMFDTATEDGHILIPSGLIGPNGTIPTSVFTAVTGLKPVYK